MSFSSVLPGYPELICDRPLCGFITRLPGKLNEHMNATHDTGKGKGKEVQDVEDEEDEDDETEMVGK